MPWEVFSEKMKKAIERRGFVSPTDIQMQGTPHIHQGKNTLLIAPTGLGKTESVLLPVLDLWLRKEHKQISMLYITPLKSLNRDLLKRILWWANELGFEVSVRHGDTTQYERSMQAQNPSDLLISTPETLQAILIGKLMRKHLSNVKWIVIDEVHELVSSKRGVQLSVGLERLKELIRNSGNPEPQIIGLSATLGSPKKVAGFLTGGSRGECTIVNTMKVKNLNIRVESPNPGRKDYETASEIFLGPETAARLRRINELVNERESVLVFTNTRETAEVLSSRLKILNKNLSIETHHSSLSKDVRIEAEEGFKKGRIKSLVCTSSLELGIDIGSIDFILQYMSPRQVTKLLQRVGRSGHTASGVSDGVIIASGPDDCFESAVIARLALEGWVEPTLVYGKSLDVLAHQIAGLALEEYNIDFKRAYSIIRKAYPFRKLTELDFLEVCELLQKLGFIWLNESPDKKGFQIRRRKRAWEYYFRNLSTIPDVKNYQVFDVVSNRPVGSLDAEFIALHGSPGTGFIVKGQAWKILEVRRNKIFVEPMTGIEAAIPAWEGELIPVPYRVAQEVGMLRREVNEGMKQPRPRVMEYLEKTYSVAGDAAGRIYSTVKKQKKFGFVPDSSSILVEHYQARDMVVVVFHTCFGSMINETLGRVLSSLLTARLGSVGLQTDPYRIMVLVQSEKWETVLETFRNLKPGELKPLLESALPNTELFHWRFLHVAQRFGIISRDADFGKGYLKKIIEVYRDSPAFREAMNEIFEEKLDLKGTKKVLEMIGRNELKIRVMRGLSYIGRLGLMRRYELVAPEKPEKEIFRIFKMRLLNTKIRIICACCGWGINYLVKDLPENLRCPQCKARLMAVIRPHETEKEELLKKFIKNRNLTKNEMEIVNNLMDGASMVVSSGKDAVVVLAGRGIGTRTAGRILAKQLKGDELLREILEAERQYARTKRFWRD